jgi:hypothetical protein
MEKASFQKNMEEAHEIDKTLKNILEYIGELLRIYREQNKRIMALDEERNKYHTGYSDMRQTDVREMEGIKKNSQSIKEMIIQRCAQIGEDGQIIIDQVLEPPNHEGNEVISKILNEIYDRQKTLLRRGSQNDRRKAWDKMGQV